MNIAQSILLNSQIQQSNTPPPGSPGPSVVSRIFDLLSRPNYAVASFFKPILDNLGTGNYAQAINNVVPWNAYPHVWQGLSGQTKNTFTDMAMRDPQAQPILDAFGGGLFGKGFGQSTANRAMTGLALDVGMDPTSYVGVGAIKGVLKGVGLIKDAKGLVEAKDALSATDLAAQSAQTAQSANDYLKSAQEATAAANAKTALTQTPQAYGQVQRATDLVSRLAGTDPAPKALEAAMPKPLPNVPISPLERRAALNTASDLVNSTAGVPSDIVLNPNKQLNLWSGLMAAASGTTVETRYLKSLNMLKTTENALISNGVKLQHYDGSNMKLSDLFAQMGTGTIPSKEVLTQLATNKINNPMLDQAVEAVKARSAMSDTPLVTTGLDAATQAAVQSVAGSTPSVSAAVLKSIPKDMRAGLAGQGVSGAGTAAATDLFKGIMRSVIPPAQQAMDSTASIAKQMMNPVAMQVPKMVIKRQALIDKAIAAHMDSPYREVATKIGDGNKAVAFLNQRFNAAYGYSDLRPMLQDSLLSAQSNATRQAKIWSDVVKGTTKQERMEAFAQAQNLGNPGALPVNADPKIAALAQQFTDHIDELFSRTGVKDAANSVATRSAFTMKDINKELTRAGSSFKFVNGKVDDPLLGRGVINYKGGAADPTKWMKSWESYALGAKEDPVEFMNKLDIATEKLAKKYALMDEIGARFGSTTRTGPFTSLAADPRFAGRYFPKETTVQINKMMEELNSVKYMSNNSFLKQMDRVNAAWKSGVTIYAPSHHIRNFIGDSWLSWVAGVNTPIPYYRAAKAMAANAGKYADWSSVGNLIAPDAMQKAVEAGGSVLFRTRGGVPITANQLYIAAHQHGLLIPARALEDIYAKPLLPRIAGGRVQAAAQGVSEFHEHFTRLAHFADNIAKAPPGQDMKTVFENAAHEVRKWHPDGMDLTGFEQQYMRRIAPFYSWTRKAFPLVWEAMLQKPGKVNAYSKAEYALQNANGIQGINREDPFPSNQLFPSWLMDKGIGPVGASGMGGLAGLIGNSARQGVSKTGVTQGGYAFAGPSNPMIDLISQFFGAGNPRAPLQGAGSMLNPALRIPIELATNRQLFSDVPPSYDPNKYLTDQIPGASVLSNITNLGLLGPTNRGQKEGLGNPETLINYLTGGGLQGSGPYIPQAQREAAAKLAAARKAGKSTGWSNVLAPK
jgi:hypothetical protein